MWLEHPYFFEKVEIWWKDQTPNGWPGYAFMEKLKGLKKRLLVWNKEVFGDVVDSKKVLIESIDEIDKEEELGCLSHDRVVLRSSLKLKLQELSLGEQQMWVQKCKLQWLSEGDENSHFFHKWATARRRRSSISSLLNSADNLLSSDNDIETEILDFFSNLYSDSRGTRFTFEGLNWSPLPSHRAEDLESPFSESKIHKAICSLGNLGWILY